MKPQHSDAQLGLPQHPVTMPELSAADFAALCDGIHWHQRWEVRTGQFTPGRNPVDHLCHLIQLPADLRGQRVLDVGACHGCFSFECERRGAAEVVALSPEPPEHVGFFRLKEAVGSTRVRYVQGSCYALDPKQLGTFDLVLFLGVLYHLRYPLLAIDNLRRVARGPVLVESHVLDACFIPPGETSAQARPLESLHPSLLETPLWQFYRRDELGQDPSNWFAPNRAAVAAAFASAGFEVAHLSSWEARAAFRATPVGDNAEYLGLPCYEGLFASTRCDLGFGRSEP